jgi:adhesin/invasin
LPSFPEKLTEKPGPATGIALALAPDEITADGVDKTSATATVTDQFGNGVKGRAVEVASDDGRAIAAPHDNGDGTYSVDVTSSRVAGVYDLTATSGALPSVPAKLTQKPGPAAVLKLVLAPDEITADGDDATTAKVTVKDQYGNGVPQVALTYSTTGTQDFGTTVDNGDGTYSTPVRAGIVAGDYHITVAGASLTTTEPLKEKPGPAKTLKLIFDPASVTANGTDKTTAKIVLTDKKGNGVPGKEIAFATSGGQTFGDASDDGGGAYSASVTASKVAGEYEITASAGSVPGMATLTEKPGPATGIALALDPDEITADGVDDTEATVTVTDQYGNGVPGRTVAITSEDGRTIAAPADNADGTYTVTVLSSKVANDYDLTATSGTLTSTAATLTEKPGPATSIVLALDPTTITADGTESTTATVTIEDQYGNGVLGRTVGVSSDDGRTIAAPADNGDGTYTVTVLSSKVAKDYDLTATSGSLTSVAATLTEVAGPAANLAVELDQAEVTANKLDTTKATATVTDKHGNLISGDDVDFSSSEDDQTIGATTDNKDGTYTATITSTTKAGEVTITGADGSLTGPAKLTQKPGPAVSLDLALHPDTITADEADGTDAIATVEDAFGNGVPGQTVRFSADGGQAVGGMTDNKDGTYTARVTSTKRAGRSTVTSASGLLAAAAPLTQIAGAPASVKLELERDSITADGDTVTNAIAKVVDANGNPVRGGRLNFASDAGNPLGQVVDNGDGTYTVAIRATRRSGRATLTATAGQASDSARLTQRPGPAARLRLALDRATIAANGTDTARATATITDINDNLVSGESVRFTSTDSGHAIGASADNGDGTYTATITASRQAGAATISAGSGSLSHAVTLTQSNLNTDLAESERTGPRFRVKRPAAARADSRGYVTVPSAWLICPRGVVSCMLNARIDARPLEADDPLPTRRQSVFASRVSTVFAPGTARIKLRLSRGARRLLRQNGRLQMTVVAVATGHIGGAQARMQKTFVVRPPKPKPAR